MKTMIFEKLEDFSLSPLKERDNAALHLLCVAFRASDIFYRYRHAVEHWCDVDCTRSILAKNRAPDPAEIGQTLNL